MKVVNVHQRLLYASPARVGQLLDTLATPDDALWPRQHWPRMRLDAPLGVGAAGGHGPIGYRVEAYEPGRRVLFRFTAPRGLQGWHALTVLDATSQHCVLEHRIEMTTRGLATLAWPLVIQPLHDALVEDALANAAQALGLKRPAVPWSPWVRLLRRLLSPAARTLASRRTRHAG